MSSKTIARPYVDKREDDFLRAVSGCQLVPDGEEATQRWSGVGARQNHLSKWKSWKTKNLNWRHLNSCFPELDQTATVKRDQIQVRKKVSRRQNPLAHDVVLHLLNTNQPGGKTKALLTCMGRSQNCWTPGYQIRADLSTSTISTGWPCFLTSSSCILWIATVPSVLPSLSSCST